MAPFSVQVSLFSGGANEQEWLPDLMPFFWFLFWVTEYFLGRKFDIVRHHPLFAEPRMFLVGVTDANCPDFDIGAGFSRSDDLDHHIAVKPHDLKGYDLLIHHDVFYAPSIRTVMVC